MILVNTVINLMTSFNILVLTVPLLILLCCFGIICVRKALLTRNNCIAARCGAYK